MSDGIDLPHAQLTVVSPNELGFDPKVNADGTPTWDDPTKLRWGAFRPADGRDHFYLGVIGMDVLTRQSNGSVSRSERGFIAMKLDNNDGEPAMPCIEIHMQRTPTSDSDEDMLCVLRISAKGIELDPKGKGGIGINAPVTQAPPRVTRFYSDDGQFCFNVQGDGGGKLVKYQVIDGQPESEWPALGVIQL